MGFPYENRVVSEENTTILALVRNRECPFSPMRTGRPTPTIDPLSPMAPGAINRDFRA
jgi:hypothetical protein